MAIAARLVGYLSAFERLTRDIKIRCVNVVSWRLPAVWSAILCGATNEAAPWAVAPGKQDKTKLVEDIRVGDAEGSFQQWKWQVSCELYSISGARREWHSRSSLRSPGRPLPHSFRIEHPFVLSHHSFLAILPYSLQLDRHGLHTQQKLMHHRSLVTAAVAAVPVVQRTATARTCLSLFVADSVIQEGTSSACSHLERCAELHCTVMTGLNLTLASLGALEVGTPDESVLGDAEVVVILMKKVVPSCSCSFLP